MPSNSKCGQCEYESDGESDMMKHMLSKHALKCEECDFNSDNTHEMENHMKKLHSIQCNFCNETFVGSKKLKKHLCRRTLLTLSVKYLYCWVQGQVIQ